MQRQKTDLVQDALGVLSQMRFRGLERLSGQQGPANEVRNVVDPASYTHRAYFRFALALHSHGGTACGSLQSPSLRALASSWTL